jgi:hypothetical protein
MASMGTIGNHACGKRDIETSTSGWVAGRSGKALEIRPGVTRRTTFGLHQVALTPSRCARPTLRASRSQEIGSHASSAAPVAASRQSKWSPLRLR